MARLLPAHDTTARVISSEFLESRRKLAYGAVRLEIDDGSCKGEIIWASYTWHTWVMFECAKVFGLAIPPHQDAQSNVGKRFKIRIKQQEIESFAPPHEGKLMRNYVQFLDRL